MRKGLHTQSQIWQSFGKIKSLLVIGGFALFIDTYDHCLILNYIILYLIKDFDGISGMD